MRALLEENTFFCFVKFENILWQKEKKEAKK
jgi:hypothetical protein